MAEHYHIEVTVGSGAANNVAPEGVCDGVPIRGTEASRRGAEFTVADGKNILNKGERVVRGVTT